LLILARGERTTKDEIKQLHWEGSEVKGER
jgi:hypothetical protein